MDDFASIVSQRLEKLGLDQRDLAASADVTESYVSQLLRRKKLPPLPNRTDIYDKMSGLLGMSRQDLARLAARQHVEKLDRAWLPTPEPRFGPMRELVLGKCRPARQPAMRTIFERDPFSDFERLITRTLIGVIRDEAAAHARDETWLRSIASGGGQKYRHMRVRLIELLDSDPAGSIGDFSLFIDPLVRWWDFDLDRFALSIQLASGATRKFGFREEEMVTEEPALRAFLRDATLSSGATADEIGFLRRMRFPGPQRPTAQFYYRSLQNLRDPLHFRAAKKPSR